MFDIVRLDRPEDRALVDRGVLPWWSQREDEALKIAFWRPVAGATHGLDFALFPDQPALMHAHSLAWLAAATILVGRLFRRWLGPGWPAGLATLAFAVDDHHAHMAGWISNRNALVGLVFGVGALLLHDRWRRDGDRLAGLLAPIAFGLALLSNEGAAAVGAFLLGHALWIDRGGLRDRLLALAPAATLGVAWLVARGLLGFGVQGSALYVDPLGDPVGFLVAMIERMPLLLHGLWLFPGPEIAALLPSPLPMIITGLASTALVAWLLRPALRDRPAAPALALGTAASLVPACATLPAGRLLVFASVGAAALLVLPIAELDGSTVRRRLAVALLGLHLVLGPIGIFVGLEGLSHLENRSRALAATLPADPAITEQTAIVLQGPSAFVTAFSPVIQHERGLPSPRRLLVLAPGIDGVTIERVDAHTLRLRLPEPAPIDGVDPRRVLRRFDGLYRAAPFRVGERVELPDVTITVTGVAAGRLVEITARFRRPLDDPSYRWLRVEGWCYSSITMMK